MKANLHKWGLESTPPEMECFGFRDPLVTLALLVSLPLFHVHVRVMLLVIHYGNILSMPVVAVSLVKLNASTNQF
jgi:hypothetical protein